MVGHLNYCQMWSEKIKSLSETRQFEYWKLWALYDVSFLDHKHEEQKSFELLKNVSMKLPSSEASNFRSVLKAARDVVNLAPNTHATKKRNGSR